MCVAVEVLPLTEEPQPARASASTATAVAARGSPDSNADGPGGRYAPGRPWASARRRRARTAEAPPGERGLGRSGHAARPALDGAPPERSDQPQPVLKPQLEHV